MSREFIEIVGNHRQQESLKMSDSLFFIDKNKTLDELVQGVRSIRVLGVNEPTLTNNLVERVGNGAISLSSRLPSKQITYEFFLNAENASELAQKQDQINKILFEKNSFKFSFYFMKDWYFIGNTQSIRYEAGTLSPKGTIEFCVFNPFKYSTSSIDLSPNQSATEPTFQDKFFPEKLVINGALESAMTITSSSGKKIKLIQNGGQGSKRYVLDFETGILTANDVELNGLIDVSSDIFDFYIPKDGRYTISNSLDTKLTIRRKELG